MAFENVDVSRLKNSIASCKNTINCNTSIQLINNISSNDVWSTAARDNLKKALKKLTNERYKELEKELEKASKIANYIEKYKNLQSENKSLSKSVNVLNDKLYKTEKYTETYTDANGVKSEIVKTRQTKDYNVQSKIDHLNNNIKDNKNEMDNLVNKVTNLI